MIAERQMLSQLLPRGYIPCLKQREDLTITMLYRIPKIKPRWFRLYSEGTNYRTADDRERSRNDCQGEYAHQRRFSSQGHLHSP